MRAKWQASVTALLLASGLAAIVFGAMGRSGAGDPLPEVRAIALREAQPQDTEVVVLQDYFGLSDQKKFVRLDTVFDETAIETAVAERDWSGRPLLSLQLKPASATLFGDYTERNVGKTVGLFVDGTLVSAITIPGRVTYGIAIYVDAAKASTIASKFNSARPLPIIFGVMLLCTAGLMFLWVAFPQQSDAGTATLTIEAPSMVDRLHPFLLSILSLLAIVSILGLLALTAVSVAMDRSGDVARIMEETLPVPLSAPGNVVWFLVALGSFAALYRGSAAGRSMAVHITATVILLEATSVCLVLSGDSTMTGGFAALMLIPLAAQSAWILYLYTPRVVAYCQESSVAPFRSEQEQGTTASLVTDLPGFYSSLRGFIKACPSMIRANRSRLFLAAALVAASFAVLHPWGPSEAKRNLPDWFYFMAMGLTLVVWAKFACVVLARKEAFVRHAICAMTMAAGMWVLPTAIAYIRSFDAVVFALCHPYWSMLLGFLIRGVTWCAVVLAMVVALPRQSRRVMPAAALLVGSCILAFALAALISLASNVALWMVDRIVLLGVDDKYPIGMTVLIFLQMISAGVAAVWALFINRYSPPVIEAQ